MMPTFPVTWYAIAILAATNLVSLSLWRNAAHDIQLVELRSEIAAQDSKRIIAEQKQITEDTTNAWKAALDTTRDSWAKRLRNANVQPMPGISAGTARVDDLPADALPLAAECAETTLMLENLQDWVKKQERVK